MPLVRLGFPDVFCMHPQLHIFAHDHGSAPHWGIDQFLIMTMISSAWPVSSVYDALQDAGLSSTIDRNNQYYQQYMYPYTGTYGTGSPNGVNHFWPIPGNHGECCTSWEPVMLLAEVEMTLRSPSLPHAATY